MSLIIRQERPEDYQETEAIVEKAFTFEGNIPPVEHILVRLLRESDAFIPELSIVAVSSGAIVGHCLITRLKIKSEEKEHESLALAPVSVDPSCQGQGIGKALIEKSIETARALGYGSIIVLGHSSYYPQFGFKRASEFGITDPFGAPDEAFMALELKAGALDHVKGVAVYPKAFYECGE